MNRQPANHRQSGRSSSSVAGRRVRGFSLLELLSVVGILGVLAAMVVVRMSSSSADALKNACYVNKGEIELQTQLWYRHHGAWPSTNLSGIGADTEYFPDGMPSCPVDGSSYQLNTSTQKVIGHTH